jgi:monovalent cation:H+ antiporter-2, CPA2 family
MPHEVGLITTLAAGLGLAMVLGLLATRLRLPPLVGYLVAGVLIGPATPGFVADLSIAAQLAEVGVLLLMFGVGLHLSFDDLLSVRRIAVPGAILQIAVATVLGAAAAWRWGWTADTAVVFGLTLSCASTVVLLRAVEDRGLLDTVNGRIAVGWLVVEDLAMVLALVLLPVLAHPAAISGATASAGEVGVAVAVTLAKVAAFIALMLLVARRVFPRLLLWVAGTGSRELFTLCVVSTAVGVAYGAAALFDVSFALGAFFAGTMMRESEFSHRAAQESLPLRDAFSVLFFVAVGMLFDPRVVVDQPGRVLAIVAIIVIGKTFAAVGLVLLFRYPLNTALTVGASLAQIGEFSFILAGLGVSLGLLSEEARTLVVAGALISIALNPALFAAIEPARAWIRARSAFARRLELRTDPLAELPMSVDPARLQGQVVIVGYGRVGRRVAETLAAEGLHIVVAEQNRELVERLREQEIAAVSGDAADPMVLAQTHVMNAAMLVVAIRDTAAARRMAQIARRLNPRIEIVFRTRSADEAELLRGEERGTVFLDEQELAGSIARHVLARMAMPARR